MGATVVMMAEAMVVRATVVGAAGAAGATVAGAARATVVGSTEATVAGAAKVTVVGATGVTTVGAAAAMVAVVVETAVGRAVWVAPTAFTCRAFRPC
jgi:hypothetical protein